MKLMELNCEGEFPPFISFKVKEGEKENCEVIESTDTWHSWNLRSQQHKEDEAKLG